MWYNIVSASNNPVSVCPYRQGECDVNTAPNPHLSSSQNHRLDAIYYYMRSLMAKNPFKSAHDSLVGLFEDTATKVRGMIKHASLISIYAYINRSPAF